MNNKIKTSIIIVTKNRADILKKCLQVLNKQSIDNIVFEVIVVDDGSTDHIKKMIGNLYLDINLNYIYQNHNGSASARNNGIKKAQGKYIIFIDDDIIVNEKFIKSHIEKQKQFDNVVVHGPVIYTNNIADSQTAKEKITDFSNAFFATGNVSIKKEHLIEAGLFDERFKEYGWEDLELGKRLKELNLKAIHADSAIGYHLEYKFSMQKLPEIIDREKQRGRTAVLYNEINSSFAVKLETLYIKPLFILEKIMNFGNWLESDTTKKLLNLFYKNNLKILQTLLLYLIKTHAYFNGMKNNNNYS
ncbi:MAG: glycosyltransferase [Halanaerobiales bacterium]|nr:glycosyltransferase [Halanaerobiales bacterium]